jgi:hypothetical protein
LDRVRLFTRSISRQMVSLAPALTATQPPRRRSSRTGVDAPLPIELLQLGRSEEVPLQQEVWGELLEQPWCGDTQQAIYLCAAAATSRGSDVTRNGFGLATDVLVRGVVSSEVKEPMRCFLISWFTATAMTEMEVRARSWAAPWSAASGASPAQRRPSQEDERKKVRKKER